MKIYNFSKVLQDDLVRVSATVEWEDCDRAQREIYLETAASFSTDLDCNPNTFLLAAIIPAWYHGERRIQVDGKICPQLRDGLIIALQILTYWYGIRTKEPLVIEATQGFHPSLTSPKHVASFMSGGVDSLATLRNNRMNFPLDHPCSIKDCFHAHGIDIGGYETLEKNKKNFDLSLTSLEKFAESAKVTIIPVYINFRYLDGSDYLFSTMSHGAVISSIAHAFSKRIAEALIPSSFDIGELKPWGSHPLLDYNYSSVDVLIKHDGLKYSRIEKVGLISDWNDALHILRSCYDPFRSGDALNCGKCEKCLRTMIELLLHGKLSQCRSFPLDDITPDIIRSIKVHYTPQRIPVDGGKISFPAVITHSSIDNWQEVIDPLAKIGRFDLAEAVEDKVKEYERYQAKMKWKNKVKRLDHRYLGGILTKLNRFRKEHFRRLFLR